MSATADSSLIVALYLAEVNSAILSRTLDLTQKHTATIGTRTLDLLHLATALELGADTLLSFDPRQKKAAQAEGLNVLP